MKHRKRTRRLATGAVAVVSTAAMVVLGLAVGSGTSAAAQGELAQNYSCTFPLIGNQNVSVNIKTTQPSTIATGKLTPAIEITAVSNAGKTATQGLRLVGAETIKGTAKATSTVTMPGTQGNQTVKVSTDVPNQPIPAVGNDLVVNATGSAPALRFDQPGTATLAVTDLELEMTPLRADGTPTELGTFVSDCTPAQGQDTILQTYTVTGPAVAPEAVVGTGNHPPLHQVYSCPFPLIGNQDVSVDINATLPDKIAVGEFTPKIGITAVSNAGKTATQGLRLVGAETIKGSALATSLVSSPQGHLAVGVPTAIPSQPIPAEGNDLVVNAAGAAPSLRFDKPGTATLSVHDLVLTMTPLTASGAETGLGTFVADCTPANGQTNVLHTFTITDAADTTAPSAPGAATVGEVTQNSVALSWGAATDNVGVTGYDVYQGSALVKTVTGTSATIDGLAADTDYSFTVKAKDAAGNASPATAPVTAHTRKAPDTQAPTAPGNPRATGTTQASVALAWDAASDNVGVTGYDVYQGDTLVKTVTEPTATIDGLTADTDYTFTVVAKDAAGNKSAASAAVTAHTQGAPDTQAPSVPGNLHATGTSQASVGLAWDAATDNVGVTGYDVYQGDTLVKTVTEPTATIEGLTADTDYTFTVVAKDAAGNKSAASAAVTAHTATTPDTEAPSAPVALSTSDVTQSSVALSWTASTDNVGVTGYDVYQGANLVKTVTGTTATVDGLTANTDYSFTVVAKDAAGNKSEASAAATAHTQAAPDTQAPTVPGNPHATGTTQTSATLAWTESTDNTGVTGYDVYNGTALAKTVTGTTATVDGLTADTEYTFTVVAKDAAGNKSAASAAAKVKTQAAPDTQAPAAPGNPRATDTTQTTVVLGWDAATDNVGVTGYDVYNGTALAKTVTGTTATVDGLTADTEYTFTVVAKDAAGNKSAASAAAKVKTKPTDTSPVVKYSYDLTGKSQLKKLTGPIDLRGGINAAITLSNGTFDADLALNSASANFTLWGFVPVTAKIEFAPVGKTAGTLKGGVLKSTSSVTVKLPRISIFGFPVSASPSCQTKTPAQIQLQSKPGFDPLAGGKLTGSYTLPPLQGCGFVNDIVSGVASGPGNTIEVNLAPRPVG
ncbi:fibronectin type III domain-containing protein [Amycolatopsis minnesotensis]|uniref:Fibronectin type-III domain-containing protein n=1 Tax=Amycolatopsis minnesotensis TaxID=337894 RepID=A0ABN2SJS4_9PSEU